MEQSRRPNKLVHEKSPYLLQHAFNPVAWYPWGEEAFAAARAEQKPIFLSVGYSTCHWCHVMEHESFENDEIASLLNSYFVCVKVDREERPDVDKVYMAALQGMGQGGGWPMSMFLTPDLKPFYGGTYFPPRSRYGRAGFPDVLTRIHQVWETDRENVLHSSEEIVSALQSTASVVSAPSLDKALLDTCYRQLEKIYDSEFGGFGGAPKFPRPSVFSALLRYFAESGNLRAVEMTALTLQKMSDGGIYDHIGGGFHRYSVDREWRVPHFEKMLYDQAQLAGSYLDVFQITGNPAFASVAGEVLEYVLRDMMHPGGGFYSAEDADSPRPESPGEEGEGAFYLWTKKEVASLLGKDDAEVFCLRYGVREEGNASFDPQHEFTGKNILYAARTLTGVATALKRPEEEIAGVILRSRKRLFEARSARPRPHRDDKILTGWNGLMISAFARGSRILNVPRYREAATLSADFISTKLYDATTGGLSRRFRDGEANHEGNLDDYAFLSQGLLDLYEATFDTRWIDLALKITETQVSTFWDSRTGGFFDTSGMDSSILVRTKEQYDGAEPAGNSVAAMNLFRLAQITDNKPLREKAVQTLLAFGELLQKQPVVMPQMVAAYAFSLAKADQIVVASALDDSMRRDVLDQIYSRYLPNKVVVLLDGSEGQKRLSEINPFFASIAAHPGKTTVYVCQDYVCRLPTSDVATLATILDKKKE